MCDAAPVEYLHHVVVDVLPFAADTTSVTNRRGVVELVARGCLATQSPTLC
jgi:hypothetical protein